MRSIVRLAAGLLILGACGAATTGSSGGANPIIAMTDQPAYAPGDTIVVTIANHRSTSVLAADHQSNCSIVSIELLVGQTWQRQNPCRLMSPTRLIEIQSGDVSVQRLQPPTTAGVPGWPSGSYRVVFTYQLTPTTSAIALPPVPFTVR